MPLLRDECIKHEILIWDFDRTLFDMGGRWEEVRRELCRRIPALDLAPSVTILTAQARALGFAEKFFRELAELEVQLLEEQDGLVQSTFALFCEFHTRSLIVSNNTSTALRRFFEMHRLEPVPFASRDMVLSPKPVAEGAYLLRRFWEGRSVLLIGDSDVDRELAENIGADFFMVDRRTPQNKSS